MLVLGSVVSRVQTLLFVGKGEPCHKGADLSPIHFRKLSATDGTYGSGYLALIQGQFYKPVSTSVHAVMAVANFCDASLLGSDNDKYCQPDQCVLVFFKYFESCISNSTYFVISYVHLCGYHGHLPETKRSTIFNNHFTSGAGSLPYHFFLWTNDSRVAGRASHNLPWPCNRIQNLT